MWLSVAKIQVHPNQIYASGHPNFLRFEGNEKRFGGSRTVIVIYLF